MSCCAYFIFLQQRLWPPLLVNTGGDTQISTGNTKKCWDSSGATNVLKRDGVCGKAKAQQHYLLVQREPQLELASGLVGHACPPIEIGSVRSDI